MIERAIQWFEQRLGRVSYSMADRNGPRSFDCSSSVYFALKEAGLLPANLRVGNTESMFNDLPKYGFRRIEIDANGYIEAKRGDIFIWGRQGQSSGAGGHTGIFFGRE